MPRKLDEAETRPKITYAVVSEKYGLDPSEAALCELKPFRSLPGSTPLYDEINIGSMAKLKQAKLQSKFKAEKMVSDAQEKVDDAQLKQETKIFMENMVSSVLIQCEDIYSKGLSYIEASTKQLITPTADNSEICKAFLKNWRGGVKKYCATSNGTPLPIEIWEQILKCLCNPIEHDGIRSVSVIARDIINASKASKELYSAAGPALQLLGTHCGVPPGSEELWNKFVSDPCSLVLKDIKTLAKLSNLRPSLPKQTLIFKMMDCLLLPQPTRAPARLVKEVSVEKYTWILNHINVSKTKPWKPGTNDFKARKGCTEAGIQTLDDLFAVEGEAAKQSYQKMLGKAAEFLARLED